jgi:hypothetical protein
MKASSQILSLELLPFYVIYDQFSHKTGASLFKICSLILAKICGLESWKVFMLTFAYMLNALVFTTNLYPGIIFSSLVNVIVRVREENKLALV